MPDKYMRQLGLIIVFWLYSVLSCFGQNYTIRTFAGGALPQHIAGPLANLRQVSAVAVDPQGNAYVALSELNVVLKADVVGFLTLVAGNGIPGFSGDNGPAPQAQLYSPAAVAVDDKGTLYIADQKNNRVRKVVNGIITTVAGGPDGGFAGDNRPAVSAAISRVSALALNRVGDLYLADGNRIRRIANGVIATIAGTGIAGFGGDGGVALAAQLSAPAGLAFDSTGALYIADAGNLRVRKIVDGVISTYAGDGTIGSAAGTAGSIGQPTAIAIDGANAVYIADSIFNRIRMISNGAISVIAGGGPSSDDGSPKLATAAFLNQPTGLAMDPKGALYVTFSDRLRKIVGDTIFPVAGGGTLPEYQDGKVATNVQLDSPTKLAFAPSGALYFADWGYFIRKIETGIVATVNVNCTPPGGLCVQVRDFAISPSGDLYLAEGAPSIRLLSNGVLTRVAGNDIEGFSGDNGPAIAAQIGRVQSVALDASGTLYFADNTNRVRQVANGIITTVAGTGATGFAGDGGPATSAQLESPIALAVDRKGSLYIAHLDRIRKVVNGTIATLLTGVGGVTALTVDEKDNLYITTSDGKIRKVSNGNVTTIAQIGSAWGIAVDSAGSIYISDVFPAGFRGSNPYGPPIIHVLTPTGNTCADSVDPSALNVSLFGTTARITLQSDGTCIWTVGNLPEWVSVDGPTWGSGSAILTLQVGVSTEAPRAATVLAGGLPIAITQEDGTCTYATNPNAQSFPATGGTGTATVSSHFGCTWTPTTSDPWITISSGQNAGSGTFSYRVAPNTGGFRAGSISVAGLRYSVEQVSGSLPGTLSSATIGHLTSAGTWKMTIDLVNLAIGGVPTETQLSVLNNSGTPAIIPWTFPQSSVAVLRGSTVERTIMPGAQMLMESTGPDSQSPFVGWARLRATSPVDGFGIFSNSVFHWDALVPFETRNANSYELAFDNSGSLATGVAVSNAAGTVGAIPVVIRDDTGAQIATATINLAAQGHVSFMLNQQYPTTAGKRGTIEFDTPAGGQISVLGLRANGPALTTLPVLASTDIPGGAIAHATYNGGFTSVFYLVNTGLASASFTLSFFDESGNPLTVPLSLPQSGANATTSALTQTLAAGAMLVVETVANDAAASVVGSAQLTTTGNVSGFEIFRWTTFGQEASVPLETRTPGSFVLVYDDTNGLTTGVALANVASTAANITVKIYSDAGALLQTSAINLVGRGHTSFLLPDPARYPITANRHGMVEFVVPPGAKINAVGLRAKADGTLTTIPVLTK